MVTTDDIWIFIARLSFARLLLHSKSTITFDGIETD